jgi:hypothetical protein
MQGGGPINIYIVLIFEHIDMWVKKCYPEIQAAALGEIDDGTDGT